MKAYPEELLKLTLEMLCLVPSTDGLENFFQQWHPCTLIFATCLEFGKLRNQMRYVNVAIFE